MSMKTSAEQKTDGIKNTLVEMYIDYVNNFISVEKFAEYYGITHGLASTFIDLGRTLEREMFLESKAATEAFESGEGE